MSTANAIKMSTSTKVKWFITFAVPIMLLFVPPGEILTNDIWTFLAITLFAILLIAFELTDTLLIGIILFTGYYVSGIAPADVVFEPWAGTAVWVTIAVLFMATMLDECGVLRRIAIVSILKIGCSYTRTLWGLWFAGLIIGVMTSSWAHYIMPALCLGVCKALGLERNRASFGIFMAGAIGAISSMDIIYNPAMCAVLEAACRTVNPDTTITYVSFLACNWPMIGFAIISMILLQKMYKNNDAFSSRDYFENELKQMGLMAKSEKKALILLAVLIGYAVVASIANLPSAVGFMIIPWLAFLPGVNIVDNSALKKVNYSVAIFVAGCLAIGSVGTYLNIGTILSDFVSPYIQHLSPTMILFGVWLLAFATNFLLTPMAVLSALAGPVSAVVGAAGISPLGAGYLMFTNLNQVILPYENAGWLLFYSFGYINIKEFIKFQSIRMVIHLIYCFVILIPYWNLIGLL